ncbi:hypothetical protein L1856_35190 [Streptomyces sp. Tue 6430]|nr:hypothetical protein [Streptomyces sp. Tue 6430]
MSRGTTARTAVSLLVAALLALPFFALTPSFAHAYTARHAEAKAQPGIKLSATPARDEISSSRPCGRSGKPLDPLRPRDRHRATATADPTPQQPERPRSAEDTAAGHHATSPAGPHRHRSRPSTTHSPAALQVFRC